MPALPDYPVVSPMRNESSVGVTKSPGKKKSLPTFLYFKDFAPLCRLSRLKQFQFFKLVSMFLNAFIHLGFPKKTQVEWEGVRYLGGGRRG